MYEGIVLFNIENFVNKNLEIDCLVFFKRQNKYCLLKSVPIPMHVCFLKATQCDVENLRHFFCVERKKIELNDRTPKLNKTITAKQ